MLSIILVFLTLLNLNRVTPQFYPDIPDQYYQNIPMPYSDQDEENQGPLEYAVDDYVPRTPNRYAPYNYNYNNMNPMQEPSCVCSCNECKMPRPCCFLSCFSCPNPTMDALANTNQNHLVFVPYPYPLTVPITDKNEVEDETTMNQRTDVKDNPTTHETTTTETPTTTTTTTKTTKTTTTAPTKTTTRFNDALRNYQRLMYRETGNEVPYMARHRKSRVLNPLPTKTIPAWVPRYGIVPIPDQLAAKLMSQLRDVRVLQAKRL